MTWLVEKKIKASVPDHFMLRRRGREQEVRLSISVKEESELWMALDRLGIRMSVRYDKAWKEREWD